MPQFRLSTVVSVAVTLVAAVMWGLAVAWTLTGSSLPVVRLDGWAAIAVSALAGVCWLWRFLVIRDDARHRKLEAEYRRREAVLLKTVARLAGVPTPPHPAPSLRPVRR